MVEVMHAATVYMVKPMNITELIWKPDYMTGDESVDLQHQYFAGLINRIGKSLLEIEDVEYEKRLLSELVNMLNFILPRKKISLFHSGLKAWQNIMSDMWSCSMS